MPQPKSHTFIKAFDVKMRPTNALVHADCRDMLPILEDGTVSLTHTSPPYNIRRRYHGFKDRQDIDRYRKLLEEVIGHLYRVTKPGGSVFWQVGYTALEPANNGEAAGIKALDCISLPIFEEFGFRLWDRIIWNYFGSMAFKSKFTNRYETILWLVRPDSNGRVCPLFQLEEIRERSKSYDGRNHLLGRNPGNVWYSERVAFGSIGKTSHVAVFPEEVSEKIVRACSHPGDVVLDPFAGTGTLPKVAYTLARKFVGCEISEKYLHESDTRLRMWGCSEVENLAIALLLKYGFHNRTDTKGVRYLAEVLQLYAPENDCSAGCRELKQSVREILEARRVTKGIKLEKQELWEKYDRIIEQGNESNKIIAADRSLAFCYAHRKRWNGVRRYLGAGQLLEELRDIIIASGGAKPFVREICRRANARFELNGGQVRCLRTDPGLGCNGEPRASHRESCKHQLALW